jgi:Bacterial PH domain
VRTYRSWLLTDFVGVILAPVTLVTIGLAEAVPGGSRDGGATPGSILTGIAFGLIGILVAACQIRSRMVVSDQGITWCHLLRTRSVGWDNIREIRTVRAASMGSWFSPGLTTTAGAVRINSVMGSRRYVANIVAAMQAARPDVPVAAPDGTQAVFRSDRRGSG